MQIKKEKKRKQSKGNCNGNSSYTHKIERDKNSEDERIQKRRKGASGNCPYQIEDHL